MSQKTNRSSKALLTLALTGAFALLLSAGGALAEVEKGAPDMILQTTQAKKPAVFPHAKHQAVLACTDCHHGKNEDGTQKAYVDGDQIRECVSCHNKEDMPNKALDSFKNAAHINCKDCHKEMAKAGKITGPTKCSGCHV
jgi:hypothetical protein